MEIKKMSGRYVRIAPEYITHETREYVELEDGNTSCRFEDTTDKDWEEFCKYHRSKPYKEECVYVNRNGACFSDPYEVFKVVDEFYGIDMFRHTGNNPFTINEETLLNDCKHQLIIGNYGSTWSADYFEVVKKVEETNIEHLPMGVVQEIKTISWVRDEEFYQ